MTGNVTKTTGDSQDYGSLSKARLYGIIDLGYLSQENIAQAAKALIEGGIDLLQLRAKDHSPAAIREFAEVLLPVCRNAGVLLIVNDHPEVAAAIEADGLHLGQDDGSLADARRIVGPKMIVGRSTHSPSQALAALEEGFDYIGFGPLFPTPTKLGRPGIGLFDIDEVEQTVGQQIPVFCIGGINRNNLKEVITAGARRVVMVSDLLTAEDPGVAASDSKQLIASIASPEF